MMKHLKYLLTIVTLMLVSGTLAQDMNQSQMGMKTSESPLAELQGEEFEIGFMSMMIAHHQNAIQMAQWILERTERPELIEAAKTIIATQQQEIEQMQQWLQDWYGQDADAMMIGMMQSKMNMMMETMMSAEDPERAFLVAMSMHHNGAIDMAQLALFRATHPELRMLAEEIIVAQAREISQYQAWLARW